MYVCNERSYDIVSIWPLIMVFCMMAICLLYTWYVNAVWMDRLY